MGSFLIFTGLELLITEKEESGSSFRIIETSFPSVLAFQQALPSEIGLKQAKEVTCYAQTEHSTKILPQGVSEHGRNSPEMRQYGLLAAV